MPEHKVRTIYGRLAATGFDQEGKPPAPNPSTQEREVRLSCESGEVVAEVICGAWGIRVQWGTDGCLRVDVDSSDDENILHYETWFPDEDMDKPTAEASAESAPA